MRRSTCRTGFADEAEAFAALQREIDAVDGTEQPPAAAQQAAADRKMDREILDAEDDIVVRLSSRLSCMVMTPDQTARLQQLRLRRAVRQISVACVQRGLNRQPSGKFVIAGTTPAISLSRVRPSAARLPSRGSEATRPCV